MKILLQRILQHGISSTGGSVGSASSTSSGGSRRRRRWHFGGQDKRGKKKKKDDATTTMMARYQHDEDAYYSDLNVPPPAPFLQSKLLRYPSSSDDDDDEHASLFLPATNVNEGGGFLCFGGILLDMLGMGRRRRGSMSNLDNTPAVVEQDSGGVEMPDVLFEMLFGVQFLPYYTTHGGGGSRRHSQRGRRNKSSLSASHDLFLRRPKLPSSTAGTTTSTVASDACSRASSSSSLHTGTTTSPATGDIPKTRGTLLPRLVSKSLRDQGVGGEENRGSLPSSKISIRSVGDDANSHHESPQIFSRSNTRGRTDCESSGEMVHPNERQQPQQAAVVVDNDGNEEERFRQQQPQERPGVVSPSASAKLTQTIKSQQRRRALSDRANVGPNVACSSSSPAAGSPSSTGATTGGANRKTKKKNKKRESLPTTTRNSSSTALLDTGKGKKKKKQRGGGGGDILHLTRRSISYNAKQLLLKRGGKDDKRKSGDGDSRGGSVFKRKGSSSRPRPPKDDIVLGTLIVDRNGVMSLDQHHAMMDCGVGLARGGGVRSDDADERYRETIDDNIKFSSSEVLNPPPSPVRRGDLAGGVPLGSSSERIEGMPRGGGGGEDTAFASSTSPTNANDSPLPPPPPPLVVTGATTKPAAATSTTATKKVKDRSKRALHKIQKRLSSSASTSGSVGSSSTHIAGLAGRTSYTLSTGSHEDDPAWSLDGSTAKMEPSKKRSRKIGGGGAVSSLFRKKKSMLGLRPPSTVSSPSRRSNGGGRIDDDSSSFSSSSSVVSSTGWSSCMSGSVDCLATPEQLTPSPKIRKRKKMEALFRGREPLGIIDAKEEEEDGLAIYRNTSIAEEIEEGGEEGEEEKIHREGQREIRGGNCFVLDASREKQRVPSQPRTTVMATSPHSYSSPPPSSPSEGKMNLPISCSSSSSAACTQLPCFRMRTCDLKWMNLMEEGITGSWLDIETPPSNRAVVNATLGAMSRMGLAYAKDDYDPISWVPDAGTEKLLRPYGTRPLSPTTGIQQQHRRGVDHTTRNMLESGNKKQVLLWTGMVPHRAKGHELPMAKARGIIEGATPRMVLDLLLDSNLVKEYNRFSLGRDDVFDLDVAATDDDGKGGDGKDFAVCSKVVRSMTKVPMVPRPLIVHNILHARRVPMETEEDCRDGALSGGGGTPSSLDDSCVIVDEKSRSYVLVSRAVGVGPSMEYTSPTKSSPSLTESCTPSPGKVACASDNHGDGGGGGGALSSEILLGVNLIRPIESEDGIPRTEFTAISHLWSPLVPIFLAKKLGLRQAAGFVHDLQDYFKSNGRS